MISDNKTIFSQETLSILQELSKKWFIAISTSSILIRLCSINVRKAMKAPAVLLHFCQQHGYSN